MLTSFNARSFAGNPVFCGPAHVTKSTQNELQTAPTNPTPNRPCRYYIPTTNHTRNTSNKERDIHKRTIDKCALLA